MPLKKLALKAGVDKENTRYTSEGGWYAADKVRFRNGSPEKIGGWRRLSDDTYLGTSRSLFSWTSLQGEQYYGIGTHLKFYVALGGVYYDITPLRDTVALTDPFSTESGSNVVTVTDTNGGYATEDFVTFSSAVSVGGLDLNGEYQITSTTGTGYTIVADSPAASTATGGGTVTAEYQIPVGKETETPLNGWGAGPWSGGVWGTGLQSTQLLRLWSQTNFGEDLVFCHRDGELYIWDSSVGTDTRAVKVSSLDGAASVPVVQDIVFVSDVSRFAVCFACNDLGSTTKDPMLIRWSDQEDITNWAPGATNQAGSLRLSRGNQIVAVKQSRQEILVWTDTSLYSLQYQGAPIVWGAQLIADNVSILSRNAVAYSNGTAYWMGNGKFYRYAGQVETLPCTLKRYVFNDMNGEQTQQVFAGTVEQFDEIWWFYPSAGSTVIDRYVVYNTVQNIWYPGTLRRTAWLDDGIVDLPIAAGYNHNLIQHEFGLDDQETAETQPIHAYITSAEIDLDDGHNFMFVHRILPDITFDGSTAVQPSVNMTLIPLKNSGSGYSDPASVGGENVRAVTRSATVPVEEFTGQINVRVRGRQVVVKIESTAEGVSWQLGSPRIDMRPDGKR